MNRRISSIGYLTAVVGEAEAAKSATCVTFSYYGSGPIFGASAKSTEFPGITYVQY